MASDEKPTYPPDPFRPKHSPLRGLLNKHSEEELIRVTKYVMENCPKTMAVLSGQWPEGVDAEEYHWVLVNERNEAMRQALPDITLVEMANVASFVLQVLHPMTEEDERELERKMAQQEEAGRRIKAHNAGKPPFKFPD